MIKNFEDLKEKLDYTKAKTIVVAAAHDEHTLEAVFLASKKMPMKYILVGNREKIKQIANKLIEVVSDDMIIDSDDDTKSAEIAVSLIKNNKANVLMKGILHTSVLLKAVLNKENGIRKSGTMSHISVLEVPNYNKLVAISDGGMIPYPTFEQKVDIIENAVDLFHKLGVKTPYVAALAAVEAVSDKMPDTLDALKLHEMSKNNEIKDCIIEGPISFDLAVSKEAAFIKGYNKEITGNVDIMFVPNIVAGNIMIKTSLYWANAKMAGCVLGAQVPIVLSSRSASASEKELSILLCLAIS